MDLQTDMTTIAFGELQGIGDDTLIVQYDSGAYNRLIYLIQLPIEGDGINLLLVEFRMRQLGGQISVIGQQQHSGRVTVQTTHRINTFRAGVPYDVDHRMALLRIVGRGHRVLRLIEQDIHLALTTNRLVMETDIIRRQHFGTQAVNSHTIDGDHAGLNKIIRLTTGTDTGIRQILIQTNRLGRIFVLLTIHLLFTIGIQTVVTFRFSSERSLRALPVERSLRALTIETKLFRSTLPVLSTESRTSRCRLCFTAKTRTGSALTFVVQIVVVHCCVHYAYTHVRALIK